jgi:hypothetical protein
MKSFYNFINEKKDDIIKLYHGTNSDINSFNTIHNFLYLSTDPKFSKYFGENLFDIKITPKHIFDSRDEKNKKKILELYNLDQLFKLCDNDFFKKFASTETWEWIEELIDKLDFSDWLIKNKYDCILITEYGDIQNPIINYIIWNSDVIKNINQINYINEKVKNEKYAYYILNQIRDKIKLILNKYDVYFSYSIITSKNYIKLQLNFDWPLEFNTIHNMLKKYKNKLLNNHIILSYYYDNRSIIVYYKEIFEKRIKPEQYLYHVTLYDNVDSIMKNGLIPKSSKESKMWNDSASLEYLPAVFATSKNNLWSMINSNEYTLLIIDTTKIKNKWYIDANIQDGDHFITYEPIPPEAIQIGNKFTLLPK